MQTISSETQPRFVTVSSIRLNEIQETPRLTRTSKKGPSRSGYLGSLLPGVRGVAGDAPAVKMLSFSVDLFD